MRAPAAWLVVFAWCAGCAGSAPEASVRPGINTDFLDPQLDVDAMVQRFEAESREVFARRATIARAVGLRPGMAVADVGAGTGVFVDFFARDVGASGRVFAVEIAPRFVERLRDRAMERGQHQVEAVLGTGLEIGLGSASVDVVFACDTYHHFEYPRATLASIHRALRDGGEFVIVDFERIPGTSRPWVLDHVRCGKDQVVVEVSMAGFDLVGEVEVGLRENYFLRFRKNGPARTAQRVARRARICSGAGKASPSRPRLSQSNWPSALTTKSPLPPGIFSTLAPGRAFSMAAARLAARGR